VYVVNPYAYDHSPQRGGANPVDTFVDLQLPLGQPHADLAAYKCVRREYGWNAYEHRLVRAPCPRAAGADEAQCWPGSAVRWL
jgi:hypothetical protein